MNEITSISELVDWIKNVSTNGDKVCVKVTTLSPKLIDENGDEYTAENKKCITMLTSDGFMASTHGISSKVKYPKESNATFLKGRVGYTTKVRTSNYGVWELKYEFFVKNNTI